MTFQIRLDFDCPRAFVNPHTLAKIYDFKFPDYLKLQQNRCNFKSLTFRTTVKIIDDFNKLTWRNVASGHLIYAKTGLHPLWSNSKRRKILKFQLEIEGRETSLVGIEILTKMTFQSSAFI